MGRYWVLWWVPIAAPAQSVYEEPMYSLHERMQMIRAFREKQGQGDAPWGLLTGGLVLALLLWAGLSPHLV